MDPLQEALHTQKLWAAEQAGETLHDAVVDG